MTSCDPNHCQEGISPVSQGPSQLLSPAGLPSPKWNLWPLSPDLGQQYLDGSHIRAPSGFLSHKQAATILLPGGEAPPVLLHPGYISSAPQKSLGIMIRSSLSCGTLYLVEKPRSPSLVAVGARCIPHEPEAGLSFLF